MPTEDLGEKLGYTVVRLQPTGTWDSEGDILDYTTTQYLVDVKHVLELAYSPWSCHGDTVKGKFENRRFS